MSQYPDADIKRDVSTPYLSLDENEARLAPVASTPSATRPNVTATVSHPSGPAQRIRRRNRMITSCLECRRRKLKCDKSHPCTNCSKFARDCVFLAPALDSASQLRLTEIKEKMGSLERVLEQDVARKAGPRRGVLPESADPDEADLAFMPEDEKDLEPTPLAVVDAAYDDDADNDLLDLGIKMGKLRLTERVGGFFRPKVSEEIGVTLGDVRNDHRTPEEKASSPEPPLPNVPPTASFLEPGPAYIAPSSGFFFGASNSQPSLIDFLPSKIAADRLLQQYWYAVHHLARLVHRPSFERRYEAFWDDVLMGIEPASSLQAVVFAAMFSGVVSMPEEVVARDFGVPKKTLVGNFQIGTETALSRANLLRTTKVETLQAFVMYMIPLCRSEMSRAHSALCGTAIRIAECMGLHRDGTEYGLSPVETHVRRLIWYQLCFLDLRTCEAQGPRPGIRKDEYDTQFPLNVDDVDLEKYPPARKSSDRWTDMTLSLIRMEVNEMHRVVWVDRVRLEKKKTSLTAILAKVEKFQRDMKEKYLPMIDERVPIQHYGRLLLDVLYYRMHIMILHRYHNSVSTRIPDRLRQIILTSGTQQLEDSIEMATSPMLQPWSWYVGAIQQWHTAFLLLIEVFAYPMRREADRIWACLDYVFEVPATLTRDQKARLILTELRDKTGAYRDLRKMRAPNGMIERLGQRPPRTAEDVALSQDRNGPQARHTSESAGSDASITGAANGESLFTPHATATSPAGSSETSNAAAAAAVAQSGPMKVREDMMIDIDWSEWDKLFPPDINTGELNLPPGSGPPPQDPSLSSASTEFATLLAHKAAAVPRSPLPSDFVRW
ncbi:hypothetical protein MMC16_001858 [Acarospora aff. strigata]|nr:hypothetical protein [Acarospora aff. strigata]